MGSPYAGNALSFLVETAVGIYVFILVLRVLLQLFRANYYNPFSQFIVRVTEPVLAPMRRLLPRIGGLEGGALLVMIAAQMLKVWVVVGVGPSRRSPGASSSLSPSSSISASPCSFGRFSFAWS